MLKKVCMVTISICCVTDTVYSLQGGIDTFCNAYMKELRHHLLPAMPSARDTAISKAPQHITQMAIRMNANDPKAANA